MEGKLNPRSYQSITKAIREGRYNGRGQVLRDMYNAYRKKGKYAPGIGSVSGQEGEDSFVLDLTSVPLPEESSPATKAKPLSG